jgi:hypothetical protein
MRLAFIARSSLSMRRNLMARSSGVDDDSTTWSNGNSDTTSITK